MNIEFEVNTNEDNLFFFFPSIFGIKINKYINNYTFLEIIRNFINLKIIFLYNKIIDSTDYHVYLVLFIDLFLRDLR